MKIKKTIKRLKQLKAMVQMIPKENIDLSMFVTKFDPDSQEDCVMCVASWLTQFPFMDTDDKLWIEYKDGNPKSADLKCEEFEAISDVIAEMYGLTASWVDQIFFNTDYDEDVLTHKTHILSVIDDAIEDYKFERARKDAWPF